MAIKKIFKKVFFSIIFCPKRNGQQYLTRLADAYRRGFEIKYNGVDTKPELKMHYFKVKDDLPRVHL